MSVGDADAVGSSDPTENSELLQMQKKGLLNLGAFKSSLRDKKKKKET